MDDYERMKAQFDELKKKHEDKLRAEGYDAAIADVVAWLRLQASGIADTGRRDEFCTLHVCANGIEAGAAKGAAKKGTL